MPSRAVVNSGDRFGKLVVITEAERASYGLRRFNCRCDCGKLLVVFYSGLSSGNSTSCGCSYKLPIPDKKNCPVCQKEFQPKAKRPDQTYCSHKCAFSVFGEKVKIASMEPSVRTKIADKLRDRGDGRSYRKRNGVHEHRLVAEASIGRKLLPGEIVHHLDENKRNNSPENLQVLPSQAEHARIHFTGVKKQKLLKTHCKNGHEMTDDNKATYKNGSVLCIKCRRIYNSKWKKAKRKSLSSSTAPGEINV